MVSFEHRLAMCKEAFGNLISASSSISRTKIVVTDIERDVWLAAVKDM
jgi:hypothetical protein